MPHHPPRSPCTTITRPRHRVRDVRILRNFLFDDFVEEHDRQPSPHELTTLMLTTICQPDLPVLLERIRTEYKTDGEWALRELKQKTEAAQNGR